MPVTRRLQLLDAARRADAWILEDDYDGEYRYSTQPVPAMYGLDRDARVIYLGTFSKVLFPALRLGYLIVPPALVDAFLRARAVSGRTSSAIDQAVVADFIEEGHFERHIRRMRSAYRERLKRYLRRRRNISTGSRPSAHRKPACTRWRGSTKSTTLLLRARRRRSMWKRPRYQPSASNRDSTTPSFSATAL